MITIIVQNANTIYYPVLEEGAEISWERQGSPGKLKFSCVVDENLKIR